MSHNLLSQKEQLELRRWNELRNRIAKATKPLVKENDAERTKRIKQLLNSFEGFCNYYFPHYFGPPQGGPMAYFHKQAGQKIVSTPGIFAILEWPRGHAKSIIAGVYAPMMLIARKEFTGMMVGSQNYEKAKKLLSSLQAELMDNQRFVQDFGEQFSLGDWRDGQFVTAEGYGCWAFGSGQSARGTREGSLRPNYGLIDDIDHPKVVLNEERVKETVEWVLSDFFPALSLSGSRMVVANNRIHKRSVLAHLVGDLEPEDPKRTGIYHSKVFAFEDEKHKEATAHTGEPAWKEYYSKSDLLAAFEKIGHRMAMREYFHHHIIEGSVFKADWVDWVKPLSLDKYQGITIYLDPSWKSSKSSDYKAWVVVGKVGNQLHILDAWVRQTTTAAMVTAGYDLFERYGNYARYYMEAGLMQDLMMDDFYREGEISGVYMPLRPDKDSKGDKVTRIENLSALFERGLIKFSQDQRKDKDMLVLIDQLMGFPTGHDDGPDALEGAVSKLQKSVKETPAPAPRLGRYRRNPKRTL